MSSQSGELQLAPTPIVEVGDDGGEFNNIDSGVNVQIVDASNALAGLIGLDDDDEEDDQEVAQLASSLFARNPQDELLERFSEYLSEQIRYNATPEVVA